MEFFPVLEHRPCATVHLTHDFRFLLEVRSGRFTYFLTHFVEKGLSSLIQFVSERTGFDILINRIIEVNRNRKEDCTERTESISHL